MEVEGIYRQGCWCPACMWFYGEEEKLSQLWDLLHEFYKLKEEFNTPPPAPGGRVMSTRQKRQEDRRNSKKKEELEISVDPAAVEKDLESGC